MITRRSASRSLRGLAVCTVAAGSLLAGCGDDTPDPSPTTTTTSPTVPATTATTAPSPASPTSTGPGFDCAAVGTAQRDLDDAYASELDRLGIGRGDPRAQSVFTIVTTNDGPAYYATVAASAPADLSSDAQFVLDYYQRLSAQAGTLGAGTGSAEDLSAAMDVLDEATAAVAPDATTATQVVQAQERLQAAVDRACSGASSTSSAATTSPAGGSSSTGA